MYRMALLVHMYCFAQDSDYYRYDKGLTFLGFGVTFLLMLRNTCANVQNIQVLFKPASLFTSQRPTQTQPKHHL